jgi:transposase
MRGRQLTEVEMPAIALRDDYDAASVRAAARAVRDAAQARRLLAIAAVYDGRSRSEAAQLGGMDRQTLRDWVHRFNAAGPDGLVNRAAPGAAAKLSPAQFAALAEIVETGPDPATDAIVRWRRIDLKAVIEQRFGVVYHERSVSRLLHALGFAHMSARPRHPQQDPEMLATFKKTSPARSPRP